MPVYESLEEMIDSNSDVRWSLRIIMAVSFLVGSGAGSLITWLVVS